MEITTEVNKLDVNLSLETSVIDVKIEPKNLNVSFTMCDVDSVVSTQKAKVFDGDGGLVAQLNGGESFIIQNHEIKRSDDSLVVEQLFNEDYIVEDTVVNDQGAIINVKYQDSYTCSTLEKRNLVVDFSEGKVIDIVIDTDTRATYTICNDQLAVFKKNTVIVHLPFTVAIGDVLNIEVAAITSTKLKLEGEYA